MTRRIKLLAILIVAVSLDGAWASTEGKTFFERACASCHALSSEEPKKSGPLLRGVVGRPSGKVEGYVYSAALSKAGLVWDAQTLDRWLEDPSALVPGSSMGYAMRNPERRALVIQYLSTLKTIGD
ncbi:COG3474 Cytochrome c2 [Burkholderiales bacterium]